MKKNPTTISPFFQTSFFVEIVLHGSAQSESVRVLMTLLSLHLAIWHIHDVLESPL